MKKLIRLNAAIVASLVSSQPLLFAYHAKAQVYSIDQWGSTITKPPTTVAQPTTGAAKPIAGTWKRNALSFAFSNSGCVRGNQPTETSLALSEQGGIISVVGKPNSSNQGGKLLGNQFSLKDSSNGLTLEYVGTLNAAGNEITGNITCRSAIGSGTAIQGFTLKLQPATVPQVNFTPSAIRETSADSYQVDLTGSDGTKTTIFYRRLNGKIFQEAIHILELNRNTGVYYLASQLKFSPDGRQIEVQIPNSRESMVAKGNANNTVTVTVTDKFGAKTTQTSAPQTSSGVNAIAYPTGLCAAIDAFCGGVQQVSNALLLPDLLFGKFLAIAPPYRYLQMGLNISSLGCWVLKGGLPPIPTLKGANNFLYGLAGGVADAKGVKFPAIDKGLAKLRKDWGLDFCDNPPKVVSQPSSRCNVPDIFWRTNTRILSLVGPMNETICVLPGKVMTSSGEADGQKFCGVCIPSSGINSIPMKQSCQQLDDVRRRNPVPTCSSR